MDFSKVIDWEIMPQILQIIKLNEKELWWKVI